MDKVKTEVLEPREEVLTYVEDSFARNILSQI